MRCRSGLKSILIILVLITGLLLSGSGASYAAESAFVDLSSAQTDYPYIKYLLDRGVINGYGDGTFRPTARLSRAEMAVLMVRANNLDTSSLPAAPHYQDVSPEFWGYSYIEAATAAGYLKGYADGTFRPDEPVSRAEAAAIILRMTSTPLPEVELPSVVTDVPSNHWARQVVAVAIDSAIMPLASKTGFAPDIPASRAEAARGLAIMLNVLPEKAHVPLTGTLVPLAGKVTLTVNGSSREITTATPCDTGCVIDTGKDGKAEIRFSDGSGLKISTGTNITIKAAQGLATILRDGSAGALVDNLEIGLKQGQILGALATTYNNDEISEDETADQTRLAGNGRYRYAVASSDKAIALRLAAAAKNGSLPW
ncbi:MAG: S-layer homology domain-containing protein [Syntrophomonadaceae bacterium]|jgi:hypothetical protein